MKKYIILLAILISATALAVNAQVKQISRNAFYEASANAYKLMSEKTRRSVTTTDILKYDGTVYSSIIETEDHIFPNKMRRVTVAKEQSEEKPLSEIIRVGNKQYSRENNGQWTVEELETGSKTYGAAIFSADCMQYSEQSDSADGVMKRKLGELKVTSEGERLQFESYNMWFDMQGFFIRTETIRGSLEPRFERQRTVTTYEYDPKDLKIEAPIK